MTTPNQVILLAANAFGADPKMLISGVRTKEISGPRQVATYLMVSKLGMSFDDIGDELGNRDRSTIRDQYYKVDEKRLNDPAFDMEVRSLETKVDVLNGMNGFTLDEITDFASHAARSKTAAIALSVHQMMALSSAFGELCQIARSAGALSGHIQNAANPKVIMEEATGIAGLFAVLTDQSTITTEEETDEYAS